MKDETSKIQRQVKSPRDTRATPSLLCTSRQHFYHLAGRLLSTQLAGPLCRLANKKAAGCTRLCSVAPRSVIVGRSRMTFWQASGSQSCSLSRRLSGWQVETAYIVVTSCADTQIVFSAKGHRGTNSTTGSRLRVTSAFVDILFFTHMTVPSLAEIYLMEKQILTNFYCCAISISLIFTCAVMHQVVTFVQASS